MLAPDRRWGRAWRRTSPALPRPHRPTRRPDPMQLIPRGVADEDRLAVVGTRAGELVALDPRTGQVRWRGGRGLHPCAVIGGAVVAVRVGDGEGPAVAVFDGQDGREQWAAALPIDAAWARSAV